MSSLLSVGGIVSGIDTDALVEGLVAAYSTPKTLMETDLEELEDEQEAVAGLQNRLELLQDALAEIADSDSLVSYAASSDDESVLSATASSDATPGSYTVVVSQLAQRETEVSQGYADADLAGVLGNGSFSVTYAGLTTDITVDDTMSLADLAAAINEQVDGVSAYLMDTGDAATPYRLVVTGEDTGAANSLSFSSTLSGTSPAFTQVQAAQDTLATINGIAVSDADTELDEAIPGLSFAVADTGTSTVRVESDEEAIAAKLQAVVDAYNDVRSWIDVKSVYNADEGIKGPLVADSLTHSVTNQLSALITQSFSGFGSLSGLSQLGITTQQDGSLEFDSEVFGETWASSAEDVVSLLTDTSTGFAAEMESYLDALTEDDGLLDTRLDSVQDEIDDTEERISDFEDKATAYEERLRAQFTAMELALAEIQASTSALSALFADTNDDSNDS